VVDLGDSNRLRVGEFVLALGHPFGLEQTVSFGIVSRKGAPLQVAAPGFDFIQTDAAINPGNSGGPLVSMSGEVVGVNTAVAGSAQGIGFAIPIDVAKPIMQQALDGKQLTRPWIGVYYQPVTKQLAVDRKLSVDQGALVDASADVGDPVVAGGPADKAGLKAGDVIVAVDGAKVDATHDLSTRILPHSPGDEITLTIVRDGSQQMLRVTLGTLPASR
jgi:serine protease Do